MEAVCWAEANEVHKSADRARAKLEQRMGALSAMEAVDGRGTVRWLWIVIGGAKDCQAESGRVAAVPCWLAEGWPPTSQSTRVARQLLLCLCNGSLVLSAATRSWGTPFDGTARLSQKVPTRVLSRRACMAFCPNCGTQNSRQRSILSQLRETRGAGRGRQPASPPPTPPPAPEAGYTAPAAPVVNWLRRWRKTLRACWHISPSFPPSFFC